MPKRRVKHVSWERESERMMVTPAMERRIKKAIAVTAAKRLAEYSAATTIEKQFYTSPGAAQAAYNLNQFAEARVLALRALELAESFPESWNYSNAIHVGHTVLGLVALQNGDRSTAIAELLASGTVSGSPQLGSFGPSMQLAKALLLHEARADVLEYFSLCLRFWERGSEWIRIWEKKVQRGVVPNFFMHSYR